MTTLLSLSDAKTLALSLLTFRSWKPPTDEDDPLLPFGGLW